MARLLSMGSNGSGQLGLAHLDDMHSPTEVPFDNTSPILRIAAGGNHTLILLANGELYSVGQNGDGRCFRAEIEGGEKHKFEKVRVRLDGEQYDQFNHVAATWEASFAVLRDGRVVLAGSGGKGEFGLGKDVAVCQRPRPIPDFPPKGTQIVDLSTSMGHVVVVLSNGQVYGWGTGRKGQLGEPAVNCWNPRRITGVDFNARKAVCGKDFTVIIGHYGEVKVIGSDKWRTISDAPKKLPPWSDLQAGWSSVFVLLQSGELLSWGRNDHKQLCPLSFPQVQRMAIGSEHGLAITASGEVMTWGWGEHGNCGPIFDSGEIDFSPRCIKTGAHPVFVGAGCATSWIAE
jgi:protein ATS1